jgi:hypothetical protein
MMSLNLPHDVDNNFRMVVLFSETSITLTPSLKTSLIDNLLQPSDETS